MEEALPRHGAELERELHESRTFSIFPDDEGMYLVRGRLPAEVSALLMRAIEAASDAIYRGEDLPGEREEDTARAAARRRADALALLAERAMAAGFGPGEPSRDDADRSDDSTPISGTRAERYQVVLHVSAETLEPRCVAPSTSGTGAAISWLRTSIHRRTSCEALGRRGRDLTRQLPAAVQVSSPARARRGLEGAVGRCGSARVHRPERREPLRRPLAGSPAPGRPARRGGRRPHQRHPGARRGQSRARARWSPSL